MSDRAAMREQAGPVAQGAMTMPMTISIVINGDVTDPRATAAKLSDAIRDELRRREPRFSRAGNKTQG